MLSVTLVVSFTFLVLVLLLTIAVLGGYFNSLKIKNTYGFRISTITFGVGEGTFTAGAPLVDATFPDRETTDGEKLRSFWSRLGVSGCRF